MRGVEKESLVIALDDCKKGVSCRWLLIYAKQEQLQEYELPGHYYLTHLKLQKDILEIRPS